MTKPSLHELLKSHKKSESVHKEKRDTKHIVLNASDARTLFFDLSKKHKFWVKNGKEINNLSELYKGLVEMDDATFKHHVTKSSDDFAKWVGDVLKDTILARRLKASRTKLAHVELVKSRIDQLRGTGVHIPTPHTRLSPDFSFIKVEQKKRPPLPYTAPAHGFKLRGAPLMPDTSFIAAAQVRKGDVQAGQLMQSQMEMLDTVKRDVEDQELMMKDIGELRHAYDNLFGEFNSIRNEMGGLKQELQKDRAVKQKADEANINEMQETIHQLREKEREILGELKFISKTEEKIVSKNEELMDKEVLLEKKENTVLNKEKHYNKLMERYDHMLRDIQGRMDNDEKKIHNLLSQKKPVQQVKVDYHHHKGDFLSDKSKKSVRTMLDRAMSGNAYLLEQMEIDDLIKDTVTLLGKKQYKKVRENLDRTKEMLKSEHLENEFKKQAYFRVFELATELDLKRK